MQHPAKGLTDIIDEAKRLGPIRVAVAKAAQAAVLKAVKEAGDLGLIEPRLVGDRELILRLSSELGWELDDSSIVSVPDDEAAAAESVRLVHDGEADAVMKGHLHTDTLMHALLHKGSGLRLPGRRVSHVLVTEVSSYPKLLHITDVAINIAPDLNAKAEIIQNAVELVHLLGVEVPKVAVLSAVETVNPAIASTRDAACLTLMARRGQIHGAVVDGPLAFDNAISLKAAREKGIKSEVAGDADIVLVPDLESGNILAKNLEFLGGATAAGIVVGLAAPVMLNSRADPAAARLAAIAMAALMHHGEGRAVEAPEEETDAMIHCAPQAEADCCPLGPGERR